MKLPGSHSAASCSRAFIPPCSAQLREASLAAHRTSGLDAGAEFREQRRPVRGDLVGTPFSAARARQGMRGERLFFRTFSVALRGSGSSVKLM